MANAKKVGTLIKKARTEAGMTQEQLARKVKGATASDIGRAERGEKELTQEQLKQVAKATGVTQKSLLDAAKGGKSSSSGKTSTSGTTSTIKVNAAEKRLVELYRKADSQTKKNAMQILKGSAAGEIAAGDILTGVINAITGKRSGPDGAGGDEDAGEIVELNVIDGGEE
ncbi:MAG: helix-turn-helix transcriptional regulator [Clostridia bacterium]|nr:helix-turn-helix transcriptional regulator [Clostridia bacterium]